MQNYARHYPVHYRVSHPKELTRLHLLVRVVAFCAMGLAGISFATVFGIAYLALPVVAAVRSSGSGATYVSEDGKRIVKALHWFASVSAWAGLTVEHLPRRSPVETVTLEIEPRRDRPVASSAIWRVVTGLPSAIALGLLCWLGLLVWLWAAISVFFTQQVGDRTFRYLVGLQRWSVRLLAYQASLVDDYPPFSFADTHDTSTIPEARVAR